MSNQQIDAKPSVPAQASRPATLLKDGMAKSEPEVALAVGVIVLDGSYTALWGWNALSFSLEARSSSCDTNRGSTWAGWKRSTQRVRVASSPRSAGSAATMWRKAPGRSDDGLPGSTLIPKPPSATAAASSAVAICPPLPPAVLRSEHGQELAWEKEAAGSSRLRHQGDVRLAKHRRIFLVVEERQKDHIWEAGSGNLFGERVPPRSRTGYQDNDPGGGSRRCPSPGRQGASRRRGVPLCPACGRDCRKYTASRALAGRSRFAPGIPRADAGSPPEFRSQFGKRMHRPGRTPFCANAVSIPSEIPETAAACR